MTKLSVVIITYNEEKNIGRCLDSVKGIADEILVFDSFSTDNTKEICQKYDVKFFQHRFDGYIDQKNRANAIAEHDFILSIDADEVLSETLKSSISEFKINPEADGFYFNRMTNYCGKWIKHGTWYPDRKLRLFNKSSAKWGGDSAHEELEMKEGASVKFLKGDLLHYSYNSISGHIAQFNKFTSLSAVDMFKRGRKASIFNIYFNPLFHFVKCLFFRLGFLDGYYGVVISFFNAFATYAKYVKLRELNKNGLENGTL